MMSRRLVSLPSEISATKGWGTLSTQWSQCLYIRSFTIRPDASGRSECLSGAVSTDFTLFTKSSFVSSGEKIYPSTPPSTSESCFLSPPSGFMVHSCDEPLSLLRKAIRSPFPIQRGWLSRKLEEVSCILSEPLLFITNSSELVRRSEERRVGKGGRCGWWWEG